MMDSRPVVVVPASVQVSHMLEAAPLSIAPRARRVGIVMIAPRSIRPADLMVGCHFWPKVLAQAGVTRMAVVLGVEAYVMAEPVLRGCQRRMKEQGITVVYFHEGHLESDQIRAWFEQRKANRRVCTDTMVKLSQRYSARGDVRSATNALRIAETFAA